MLQMTLTRMPSGEPVGLTFTEATAFNIDRGAEGAMILAPHYNGTRQMVSSQLSLTTCPCYVLPREL